MAKDRQTPNAETSIPKSYSERRKLKKVQVERHRRERINRSMGTLRDLLCQGRPEMAADIDRAQILELAVSMIRRFQQPSPAQPSMHRSAPATSVSYRVGFSGATTAISSHLESACADAGARARLMNHLATYRDFRYNMTSPELQRAASGGSFLPVQSFSDATSTHSIGPLFVDCGSRNDVTSREGDISRDHASMNERMETESPRANSPNDNLPRHGRMVDENNNNDMWRPW